MALEPTAKRRRRRISASPPRVSAKQTAESVVAAANAQRDVLRLVPERLRRLEGALPGARPDAELAGYCVSTMPEPLRRWAFDLTKRNMRDAYERTWGWDNREKRRELSHSDARFLVAHAEKKRPTVEGYGSETVARRDRDDKDDERRSTLVARVGRRRAFVHVRFEVEADDAPVVYAYSSVRRRKARGRAWGVF